MRQQQKQQQRFRRQWRKGKEEEQIGRIKLGQTKRVRQEPRGGLVEAFREWSNRVFEKYLSSLDDGYLKDLKEIHEKQSFDLDLVGAEERSRAIKLHSLLASLMRGERFRL